MASSKHRTILQILIHFCQMHCLGAYFFFCCTCSPVWTLLHFKSQSLDCIFQVNWKWKLATSSKLIFPQGWATSATLKGTINLKPQLKLANETVYTDVHWFLDYKGILLVSICIIILGFTVYPEKQDLISQTGVY